MKTEEVIRQLKPLAAHGVYRGAAINVRNRWYWITNVRFLPRQERQSPTHDVVIETDDHTLVFTFCAEQVERIKIIDGVSLTMHYGGGMRVFKLSHDPEVNNG